MQNKNRRKVFENGQRRISSDGFHPSNTINEEIEFPDKDLLNESNQRHQKRTFEYPEKD